MEPVEPLKELIMTDVIAAATTTTSVAGMTIIMKGIITGGATLTREAVEIGALAVEEEIECLMVKGKQVRSTNNEDKFA